MQTNKISSHPPSKKPVEEFILGAEQKKYDNEYNKHKVEIIYPWQASSIRGDVQKVFTAKLPEEYILKIKFISDKTNKSQQKIIREIICQEVNKIISQLT
ncbi:MAG: hypothetical protein ACJBCI_00915 [Candidatus Tisiphia sp.]|jgi:hypothetical protein